MRKEEEKEKQTADKKLAGMMKASDHDGLDPFTCYKVADILYSSFAASNDEDFDT